MNPITGDNKARKVAGIGIMLAMIVTLSLLERLLPPLAMLPPGVSLGLSNIITMYCVFFTGARTAVVLSVLKSVFVLLTRGPVAGLLSCSGGLLSILVIALLILVFKRKISYIAVSICGAVAHNIGQIAIASLIVSTGLFYYIPVLIVSGVIMGIVTGTVLTVLLPAIHKTFEMNHKK